MRILSQPRERRGLVLIAVLIVITMLTYSAYEFSHWISVEAEMTALLHDQVQARYLAESGVAYLGAIANLRRQGRDVPDPHNYAELFEGVTVPLDVSEQGQIASESVDEGRFSIFAMGRQDDSSTSLNPDEIPVRFGTAAEAGRLDLNHWAMTDPEGLRLVLLEFPGATPELVDAILDWIDADDEKRESGAEREDYAEVDPPIVPRNGPIETVEELLLVQGMTPDILYGEDRNRNGQLDPNEDDGDASPPFDDQDGSLTQGWADLLTLHTVEPMVNQAGAPRIYLNDPDLGRLYDALMDRLGEPWARFIIASRVVGMARVVPRLDLPTPGSFGFQTVLDLVDTEVVGEWEGEPVAIASPVQSQQPNFAETLSQALVELTVHPYPERIGRVDLRSAGTEVLKIIAGMTEEQTKELLELRDPVGLPRELSSEVSLKPRHLIADALGSATLPLALLQTTANRWTTKSPVVRLQCVGFFDDRRVSHRIEVVLDRSPRDGQVLSWQRRDRWGSGNSLERWGRGTDARPLPPLGETTPTGAGSASFR